MRLWLKDDERLPDPPPMATDDRLAFAVGTALWIVAAVLAVVFTGPLGAHGDAWVPATTFVGVGAGLVGLLYTQLTRVGSRRVRTSRRR